MATRDEYLARTQGYKRPAINFNKRDDIREFAGSGHGQNYNRMMDIQRQLPNMDRSDPMVQEFKDRRRTLNRYGKNPMGEMLGYTPHEMMDKYVDLSRDVRQTNKPVYNKMYPFTGGFMDYTEGGGLPGLLIQGARDISGNIQKGLEKNIGDPLRAIGSDILNNVGIGGALDTSEEELRNYGNLTYPTDVHPGLIPEELPPYMREDEGIFGNIPVTGDLPPSGKELNPRIPPWSLDLNKDREMTTTDTDLATEPWYEAPQYEAPQEPLPFDQGKEDFIRIENEYIPPVQAELGIPNPQGDFDRFNEYPTPDLGIEFGVDNWEEPPPFNDDLREAGIASTMKSGYLAGRRPYEDEYRAFVESSGPSKVTVTYEDFMETYLPRIQESRGALRAPLNSQGRR